MSKTIEQPEFEGGIDFESLTEEELGKGDISAPAPREEITPPTPTTDTKADEQPAAAAATPKSDDKANAASADAAAAAPAKKDEAQLLAGKFKTTEELAKGFLEIAKPLKYNSKVLEKALELAKKTNDWAAVEEMYLELNAAVSANVKAAADASVSASPAAGDPSRDTLQPTPGQDADERTVQLHALEETLRDVSGSDVARELLEAGIPLPDGFMTDVAGTKQYMAKLKVDFPVQYLELKTAVERKFQEHIATGKQVLKAFNEREAHETQLKTKELDRIKAYAQNVGMQVADEQLGQFIADKLKSQTVFEDRFGVPYLKPDALFHEWLLANHDAIVKSVRLSAEIAGRTQHATDLADMRKRSGSSPSTAGSSGAHRADPPKIDMEDVDQVTELTDEQLGIASRK